MPFVAIETLNWQFGYARPTFEQHRFIDFVYGVGPGRRRRDLLHQGSNAIETCKASKGGDGLRIREDLPVIIARGHEALTPQEKDLLKWVGVFFRKPTPGRFMMRLRMPNGFSNSEQLRAISDLSRRLGNSVIDITTRQQIELRGFTLSSVPEIWERLRGVNLHSLQTGMDNVRNINGCPLAGLTPYELLDASAIVFELDRRMVGADGNPEFTNLPRKFNITVTGCLENCTHSESQDIALVPAIRAGRLGFNLLVGGKMGSGGFTVASPLDLFVEPQQAADVVIELVRIYRDHGPREARSKCRLAFLIEEWGLTRLRRELVTRLDYDPGAAGTDIRQSRHNDHLGVTSQQQLHHVAVGLCIPMGRVGPDQLAEAARLADAYGNGAIRFTTGQNLIIPNVPRQRLDALLQEPLLEEFPSSPSPFQRGLVACVGTDFCNLAQIETKQRALELSQALEQRLGPSHRPLKIHWSGCPAGCGNHQAADIGFRGLRAKVGDQIIEAVAIYTGGRTGPHAVAGKEVVEIVPCDASLPDVVASLIDAQQIAPASTTHPQIVDSLPEAARTASSGGQKET
jgi:ferredoxin-nitrite reductase